MDQKDLVSIVIPIYNVEKYLDRCINSVVNQTYYNLEIILVDDGSPDNCPRICDKWCEKDKRIKVVHKKNEGLGMARNSGIEVATGKYICFFDSDDYVDINAIETAYRAIKKYSAELVHFGYRDISSNGKIKAVYNPIGVDQVYNDRDVEGKLLPAILNRTDLNVNLSAWSCLYSLDLIKDNNWRFISEREIISEDVYSILELYYYLKTVVVIKEALYNYCENGTSLTRVFREDRFGKILEFYQKSLLLAKRCEYSTDVINALSSPFLANIIGAMKLLSLSTMNFKSKKKVLNNLLKNSELQKALANIDLSSQTIKRKLMICFMKKQMALMCLIATSI